MRVISRMMVVTGLSGVLVAGAASAQEAGGFELGAFARYTAFDQPLELEDALGGGGRIGFFLVRNLELEAAVSFARTEREGGGTFEDHIPIYGRLVYNLPVMDRLSVLAGAGVVYNDYHADATDFGGNGLLGLRYWLNEGVSIRLEGLADYMPSPTVGDKNTNWTVQLGLSSMLGGRATDSDGDGVADKNDMCPGTAPGEMVDSRGCALDADGDGVSDMRDQCPNTPAGVTVDANGCPVDSDRDGVADYQDRCENTPAGVAVDENGCPPDADGDGVFDAADRCPDTPSGVSVDANGCPLDADGDGVADYQDRCPDTPTGATVGANGCPVDTDGDGVADGIDRCPNTPTGTEVDASGCPVLFEQAATRIVLEGVTFETNSADLTAGARSVLDRVAETLLGNPEVQVEVGGHTDNTGAYAHNVQLSQSRADAVVAYLIQQGVAAERLEARGYGPDEPMTSNSTREGRAQNRRVELRRTAQ